MSPLKSQTNKDVPMIQLVEYQKLRGLTPFLYSYISGTCWTFFLFKDYTKIDHRCVYPYTQYLANQQLS